MSAKANTSAFHKALFSSKEEKEKDKVGEACNPVSLSQGFGGVMGSKTEKVCWRKFMMLHETQKPTLTLLKRKVG